MKKLLLGTVILAAIIYLLFSYFFTDIQINKYTNIDAVTDQKAIHHGWIPAILPLSAYDIVETHDIDTNTLFGTFKYKEKDEHTFMKHLTKVVENNDTLYWGNFLFKVDTVKNSVKFRNKGKE